MTQLRKLLFFAVTVTVVVAAQAQPAGMVLAKPGVTLTNIMPPAPFSAQSPVDFFRQLLLMSPPERSKALEGRAPEARARIMAKIREYLALDANERELRLRATELRWYLTPLLRIPRADRGPRLAAMPSDLQALAKTRLTEWDVLPPALQQEFLSSDRTLNYVMHVDVAVPVSVDPQKQRMAEQINAFFDLKPWEKQRLLTTLSEAERSKMEQTLKTFDQLPPPQRAQCIRNYAKFAGMSGTDRAEFLKNAESWSKMSPEERQTWRDLVAHIPLWPPPPIGKPPMPPPLLPKPAKSSMATN
jgi:hypothetical protein